MNIFRLVGDLSHLAAIVILLLKIWKTRSCAGISGKITNNLVYFDVVYNSLNFQVDHRSFSQLYSRRVTWTCSPTSFLCITLRWRFSSLVRPLALSTWCTWSLRPRMTPTMTPLGKLKSQFWFWHLTYILTLIWQDRIFARPNCDPGFSAQPRIQRDGNLMDLLHLLGVRCYSASVVYGAEDRWGRIHHFALSLCLGILPRALHSQLDLQILFRG